MASRAREAPAWVLDAQVSETREVTLAQVRQALDALQIKGVGEGTVGTGAAGKILVATVRHLMSRGGYYSSTGAVAEETPTKADPVSTKAVRGRTR